tara:strand:+ start:15843 stop:16085 length:243 start_codon:yes stop_codon:yes gene_type:complete
MSARFITNSSDKDEDFKMLNVCEAMTNLSGEMYEGIELLGAISDDPNNEQQRSVELQDMILSVRLALQKIKIQAKKSKVT